MLADNGVHTLEADGEVTIAGPGSRRAIGKAQKIHDMLQRNGHA